MVHVIPFFCSNAKQSLVSKELCICSMDKWSNAELERQCLLLDQEYKSLKDTVRNELNALMTLLFEGEDLAVPVLQDAIEQMDAGEKWLEDARVAIEKWFVDLVEQQHVTASISDTLRADVMRPNMPFIKTFEYVPLPAMFMASENNAQMELMTSLAVVPFEVDKMREKQDLIGVQVDIAISQVDEAATRLNDMLHKFLFGSDFKDRVVPNLLPSLPTESASLLAHIDRLLNLVDVANTAFSPCSCPVYESCTCTRKTLNVAGAVARYWAELTGKRVIWLTMTAAVQIIKVWANINLVILSLPYGVGIQATRIILAYCLQTYLLREEDEIAKRRKELKRIEDEQVRLNNPETKKKLLKTIETIARKVGRGELDGVKGLSKEKEYTAEEVYLLVADEETRDLDPRDRVLLLGAGRDVGPVMDKQMGLIGFRDKPQDRIFSIGMGSDVDQRTDKLLDTFGDTRERLWPKIVEFVKSEKHVGEDLPETELKEVIKTLAAADKNVQKLHDRWTTLIAWDDHHQIFAHIVNLVARAGIDWKEHKIPDYSEYAPSIFGGGNRLYDANLDAFQTLAIKNPEYRRILDRYKFIVERDGFWGQKKPLRILSDVQDGASKQLKETADSIVSGVSASLHSVADKVQSGLNTADDLAKRIHNDLYDRVFGILKNTTNMSKEELAQREVDLNALRRYNHFLLAPEYIFFWTIDFSDWAMWKIVNVSHIESGSALATFLENGVYGVQHLIGRHLDLSKQDFYVTTSLDDEDGFTTISRQRQGDFKPLGLQDVIPSGLVRSAGGIPLGGDTSLLATFSAYRPSTETLTRTGITGLTGILIAYLWKRHKQAKRREKQDIVETAALVTTSK